MEALLDKPTILHKVETEYQAFADLLAPLDGWQLTTPGVEGEWSIKDMLIHLTASHKELAAILQAACQEVAHVAEDIECLNEQFISAARARPLRDVWAAFQTTYAQMKQSLEALNEQALQNPQQLAGLDGMTLQQVIACDTYSHYEEHALAIHLWLA
jgi:uncharacterized protein (TIGR03083 family)